LLAGQGVAAPQWARNALLQPAESVPRFLRTGWDAGAATDFGPWRMLPRADPLDTADVLDPAHPQPANTPAGLAPRSDRQAGPDAGHATGAHSATQMVPAQPSADQQHQMKAAVQAARAQAHEEGVQAGAAQARAEIEQERSHERELLRHLSIELRALHDDPQRFFEPLKRLAVHLAEELVRAELQVSGKVIAQLVQQSLAQLDSGADKAVVSLNPDDLQRLQALGSDSAPGLRLHADPDLRVGSVRVRYNETVVQDLIDTRLEALVRPLLNDPEAWLSHSTLLNPVQAMPADKVGTAAEPPWKRGTQTLSAADVVEDATLRKRVDDPDVPDSGANDKETGIDADQVIDADLDAPQMPSKSNKPGEPDHGL
jgi:flagellar biosynthesis/type III secretory pathway protein FliH